MSNSEIVMRNKRKRAADEAIFDSVFNFFMDFADKVEAIVPKPLPVDEDLIKEVFGEIIGNLLDRLPNEGKEEFLVKCFQGFMNKLPEESRTAVNAKIKKRRSGRTEEEEGEEEEAEAGTPIRAKPSRFPTGDLIEVGYEPDAGPSNSFFNVKSPKVVRGGQGSKGNQGSNANGGQ